MKSFFDPSVEAGLLARIDRLEPDTRSRWGRMSCPEMVCHLADSFRGAMGEHGELEHRWNLFDLPLVRRLFVFTLPWVRARIPAPSAFQTTAAADWEADLEGLRAAMARFRELRDAPDSSWQVHPFLGRLSTREWGWLAYRHTDFHLRQFDA